MKRIIFNIVLIITLIFNIDVYASNSFVVKPDTTSTYIPTNIVNGTFDEVPWLAFKFEGVTYSKEDLDNFDYDNFSHGDEVETIYNGINEGWNTTTNIIYSDGKLFDWTKMVNGSFVKHAINATYNGSLQTSPNYSFIEMNASEAAVFFQDLNTKGGDVIRWTLNHGIRPTGYAPVTQIISVEIGAPNINNGEYVLAHGTGDDLYTEIEPTSSAKYTKDGVTNGSKNSGFANASELVNLSLNKYTQEDGWYDARGVYVVPNNQTVTRFAFRSDVDNADGNMLDDITFSTLIGNLSATLNEDKTVTVAGYWGETDPSKKLVIKIGDETYSLDMSSISGNFTFDISRDMIGSATYIEVYHEDYKQVKKEVKIVAGKVTKNTTGDGIKINSDDEAIINALDEETKNKIKQGEDVDLFIEINKITDTIDDEEKEVFISNLNDYELGEIYDISLYKKLESDEENVKVTELQKKLEFSITVPESLISTTNNRKYKILNYYDGKIEEIIPVYDKATNTLVFKTDKVSKIAIVYYDEVIESKTEEINPEPEVIETKPEEKNPKTEDNYYKYLVISFISLSSLIYSTSIYSKKY